MHGDRVVAPGIFKLLAAIRDINELHAQRARQVFEAPRLVAQFRGKEQQAFGRITRFCRCGRQGPSLQTNDPVGGKDSLA